MVVGTTITKVIRGKYYNGVDSSVDGYIAKAINDIVSGCTAIHSVTITKSGKQLVAIVVYEA